MSMELIAIIGVGIALISATIALAGLILNSQRAQRAETQAQFQAMREEFKTTREAIGELRERMAHLEGLVEGLSDVLLGRRVAEEPAKYGTN